MTPTTSPLFQLLIIALLQLLATPFVVPPSLHSIHKSPQLSSPNLLTPLARHPLYASPNPPPKPSLTAPMVAEMVETTFVNACMQLSSGYVDVLKLFIVAAKAGYELGLTIPQLQLELSSCKSQSAGRPLLAEEVELRSVWISLVYLTLERVSHLKNSSLGDTVDPSIRQKFYTFVYDVVNAQKQGYTLQTLKLENLVRSGEGGGKLRILVRRSRKRRSRRPY